MTPIDDIRLGQQARDQLIRLKRITGIEHWNALCRWAFSLSMADKNPPPRLKLSGKDTAVEISWKTFAGEYAEIYLAVLIQRAHDEGREASREVLSELLRLHIVRGISMLTARRNLNSITDFVTIAGH